MTTRDARTAAVAWYLLLVRARAESDPTLGWAAAAYGLAALTMLLQVLGFPSFAPGGGLLRTTSTGAAALYLVWHVTIPTFCLVATTSLARHRRVLVAAVAVVVVVTGYVAWGGSTLPTLIGPDGRYTATLVAGLAAAAGLSGVAVLRWQRGFAGRATWSHVWVGASLVLCFWDVAMHTFAEERFTVFWWASLGMRVAQYAVLAAGLLTGLVSLFRALSDFADERDAAALELAGRNEDVATFSHVVAHDLRSPLTAATGFVLVARRQLDDEADGRVAQLLDRAVPAEEWERVFEPFHRTASARRDQVGTGLGLAICARVAQRHGGGIWIEPTAGTTFVLDLPFASATDPPDGNLTARPVVA